MASAICKFRLTGMKRTRYSETSDITTDLEFSAVSSGSEENKTFYKYTPSGDLAFRTVNDAVVQGFDIGKEYYIVITDQKPAGL